MPYGQTDRIFKATRHDAPCVRGVRLDDLLLYNPEAGTLYWKERPPEMFPPRGSQSYWNMKYSGKEALTSLDGNGYRHGTIFRKSFRAHRVAWAIYYGEWPNGLIDHINGITCDNSISNLRCVTPSENSRNSKLPSDNKSGQIGVHWNKASMKWRAQITVNRKVMILGDFENLIDAVEVRRAA